MSTIFLPLTVLTGMWGMNIPLPHFPGGDGGAVLVGRRHRWSPISRRDARRLPRKRLDLIAMGEDPCACRADLANQIAAGEVVERPASVIKELVENSIDAGARRIVDHRRARRQEADSRRGRRRGDGRRRMRGWRSSATRRARSARADDLERIATLGFRGEALPSIASVSHFTLRTRARGADIGHRDPRQRRRRGVGDARRACRRARRSKSPTCSTTCRRAASS